MAGKGDKPRPIKKLQYNINYENINWETKKSVEPKLVVKAKGKTKYTY